MTMTDNKRLINNCIIYFNGNLYVINKRILMKKIIFYYLQMNLKIFTIELIDIKIMITY